MSEPAFRPGDMVTVKYPSRFDGQVGEVIGYYRGLPSTVDVRFGAVHYDFFADELQVWVPPVEEPHP